MPDTNKLHPLRPRRWTIPHDRRHRHVHPQRPTATWLQRAGCAGALAGVVALGVCNRPATPDVAPMVTPLVEAQDRRVCVMFDAIVALAFLGISPPPDATVEDFRATMRANAQLAEMRKHVQDLEEVKEMGCG